MLTGAGCAAGDDLLAEYMQNSGPLPPQYAWEITTQIHADGRVTVKHCKGYEGEGEGQPCESLSGKTSDAALAAIRAAASSSGLQARPAALSDMPMIGGGSTTGRVHLDGAVIELPDQPAAADAERVAAVLTAIRDAIPADLQPEQP